MILVIGGTFNDKLGFVLDKYNLTEADVYDGKSMDVYNNQKVIYNFHEIIKNYLRQGREMSDIMSELSVFMSLDDIIIISDEVGYGIVPLEKEDRIFRETLGRICCHLAKEATEVYRVIYGIGTRIKGE